MYKVVAKFSLWILLVLILSTFLGCSNNSAKEATAVVNSEQAWAIRWINQGEVSEAEVQKLADELSQTYTKCSLAQLKNESPQLRKLIIKTAFEQKTLDYVFKHYCDEKQIEACTEESVLEKLYPGQTQVTQAEITNQFNLYHRKYQPPQLISYAQIVLNWGKSAIEKQQKQKLAQQILSRLQASTKSFADLAKEYSNDSLTKDNGGIVEAVPVDGLPQRLKTSLISSSGVQLVETSDSFFIVQRLSLSTPKPKSLSELSAVIKNELQQKKLDSLKNQLFLNRISQRNVEINLPYLDFYKPYRAYTDEALKKFESEKIQLEKKIKNIQTH